MVTDGLFQVSRATTGAQLEGGVTAGLKVYPESSNNNSDHRDGSVQVRTRTGMDGRCRGAQGRTGCSNIDGRKVLDSEAWRRARGSGIEPAVGCVRVEVPITVT